MLKKKISNIGNRIANLSPEDILDIGVSTEDLHKETNTYLDSLREQRLMIMESKSTDIRKCLELEILNAGLEVLLEEVYQGLEEGTSIIN